MLPILLACAVWLPAMVGLGMPLGRLLRRASGTVPLTLAARVAFCGFAGMFTASTVAAVANLFLPLYPWVSSALLSAGWSLVIRSRKQLRRLATRAWWCLIGVTVVTVLIDARGLAWYDTGLYHLQAVRWVSLGPLPRGLANLDGRLGFNSAWFTLAGAIETPLLLGKSCFILDVMLTILIALPAVDAALRLRGRAIRPDQVVLALMLIPIGVFGIAVGMISSLSPDLPVMLLELFVIALWVRSDRFTPQILLLVCFAVMIKLSAAPLMIFAAMATVWWTRERVANGRPFIAVVGFIGAAAIVFIVRGIWLTGCPLFPSTLGRISAVRWTVPLSSATGQAKSIEFWAKYQQSWQAVKTGTPWIAAWLSKFGTTPAMVVALILFAAGIVLVLLRRPRRSPAVNRAIAASLAVLPAIGFWFFQAPQIRFGYGSVFGAASLTLAIGLAGFVPNVSVRCWRLAMTVAAITLPLASRIDRQILRVRPFAWPEIPAARMVPRRLDNGTTVWKPLAGDQVWNTPLIATPEPDARLRWVSDSNGRIREFWVLPQK